MFYALSDYLIERGAIIIRYSGVRYQLVNSERYRCYTNAEHSTVEFTEHSFGTLIGAVVSHFATFSIVLFIVWFKILYVRSYGYHINHLIVLFIIIIPLDNISGDISPLMIAIITAEWLNENE